MTVRKGRLTIVHTNDIHSHLEAASRIAGYVKALRDGTPADQLLVVDCGDFLDRARLETEGTGGGVNRELLQEIGYDAVVPGNNEGLTYTFEQLDVLYGELSIPVICANFRPLDPSREVSWLLPSLVLNKAGMKIGLIGLTAPFNDYYRLLGWKAAEPIEAAAEEVRRLREQVDLIIVLSHLGLRQDERLASAVEGIDLILGAHTHHLLEKPLYIGNTAISAAGKFGQHIGRLDLTREANVSRMDITGGCFPAANLMSDPGADSIIRKCGEEAVRRMNRTVALLDEPLPWVSDQESPLSNLLAAVVRRRTRAEIGMVNAGQFLGGLPAGKITEALIHSLCPSPINCCCMRLTGREILQAMEESLLPEYYDLEIRGFGFRGKRLGTLCYDGLEAEVDPFGLPHQRYRNVRINGEPMDPDREYEVGTLDMFTFGVGYTGLKAGRDVRYLLPELIRELLCDALSDRALIDGARKRRILLADTDPS
jgi:5'-nucleotidase